MQDTVHFHNMTIEECDKDPRNFLISKSKGEHAVAGPLLQTVGVTKPMKLREVNIGTKKQPKLAKIGDYWDDDTVRKVVELLIEYQDLFPTKFSKLKGITGDLEVMRITLKPYVCPVMQRPYRLNLRYKQMVKEEIDKILIAGIIEPFGQSDWVSLMVVQENKMRGKSKSVWTYTS